MFCIRVGVQDFLYLFLCFRGVSLGANRHCPEMPSILALGGKVRRSVLCAFQIARRNQDPTCHSKPSWIFVSTLEIFSAISAF